MPVFALYGRVDLIVADVNETEGRECEFYYFLSEIE